MFRMLCSFLLTGWLYSEALLIFPDLQPAAQFIIQNVRIPTHDEWPENFSQSVGSNLRVGFEQTDKLLGFEGFSIPQIEMSNLSYQIPRNGTMDEMEKQIYRILENNYKSRI